MVETEKSFSRNNKGETFQVVAPYLRRGSISILKIIEETGLRKRQIEGVIRRYRLEDPIRRPTKEDTSILLSKFSEGSVASYDSLARSIETRRGRELRLEEKEELKLRVRARQVPKILGRPPYDEFCDLNGFKKRRNTNSYRALIQEIYAAELCSACEFAGNPTQKPITRDEIKFVHERLDKGKYETGVYFLRDDIKNIVKNLHCLKSALPYPIDKYSEDLREFVADLDNLELPLRDKKALFIYAASCLTTIATNFLALEEVLSDMVGFSVEEVIRYLRIARDDLPQKRGWEFLEDLIDIKKVDGRTNRSKTDRIIFEKNN